MAAVAMNHPEPSEMHVPSTVSVVICAADIALWDELVASVAALETQSRLPDQVIIVVDHHDPLLRQAADELGERDTVLRIEVVANTLTLGRAGARNAGLAWADGEIVAFVDAGCRFGNSYWIATLLEDYTDPDVAGVGGGVAASWDQRDAPRWMPRDFAWAFGCRDDERDDVADVDCLLGGNMSFRREVFDELGGFRTDIGQVGTRPVGGDDLDYCLRVQERFVAARLVLDPDLDVARGSAPECPVFADFRTRCWNAGLTRAMIDRRPESPRRNVPAKLASPSGVPRAVVRGIGDGLRGETDGFRRAGAAVVGFGCTAAGYARGRVARRITA